MVNRPKKQGTEFERRVADHAAARGLPWDRAPLRGSRDLLDIEGCLPMGWLVGCKSLSRGVPVAKRLSEAMTELPGKLENAARVIRQAARDEVSTLAAGEIIPVQVVQQTGKSIGQSFTVTELGYLNRSAAVILTGCFVGYPDVGDDTLSQRITDGLNRAAELAGVLASLPPRFPWAVIARRGYKADRDYAITTLDSFLELVTVRAKWSGHEHD